MDNLLISQINLGGTLYDLKDAAARADIESLQSAVAGGTHYIGKTTSNIVDGSTTNPVVIGGEDVTAVAGDIVIKDPASGASETALEYIFDGTKWSELGSTGHLKGLAYQDQATGSYTPAGSVSVTLSGTSVVASATQGTLPSKAADTFSANVPTAIDTTKFTGGSKAADSFTPASCTNTTRSAVATEGITGTVSGEVLTFSAANTTTASYITDFDGGSFTEGAFTAAAFQNGFVTPGSAASFTEGAFSAGTLPTFTSGTVGVDSASFTGTAATITVD